MRGLIGLLFIAWAPAAVAQGLRPTLSYHPGLAPAVARAFAAAQGPLINAANIRVRTDASGYLLVASQDYTAPDGPLRTLANTLVRTDANGYLIITNPDGLGGGVVDATYWVGAAHADLTAEINLGALSTALVLNTAGTPSAYAGTSCTAQFIRSLSLTGVATCASVNLAADVTGTLPVGNGGTGLTSGTSGGVLGFTASGTLASSAALAANQLVLGGGAGATPTTLGSLGTTTTLLHGNAAGAPSFAAVVSADLNITTTTCTNQFVTALSTGAVGTCTTATLAGAQFANQGTTTTLLHGNAAGNPSFAAVDLAADVTGDLPFANLTQGSALSVLGVTGNATADVASLAAGTDNQVLRRSGTSLAFGAVNIASSDAVTGDLAYANLTQAGAASRLLGRGSAAGAGDWQDISLGSGLSMSGTTLSTTGGGAPTEETTTLTGTQNNFDLDASFTYLRCNNTSALVLTGFTVSGAAPSAGDRLLVHNVGTSTVRVADQDTGSTAGNRANHPSVRGQIIGGDGMIQYVYDDTDNEWKFIGVNPGAAIVVTFDSGNFTGSGSLTWTVQSADQEVFSYSQVGKYVNIALAITSTSTSGSASDELRVTIPNSFSFTRRVIWATRVADAGTYAVGLADCNTSRVGFFAAISGATNWSASASNNTHVWANVPMMEVD